MTTYVQPPFAGLFTMTASNRLGSADAKLICTAVTLLHQETLGKQRHRNRRDSPPARISADRQLGAPKGR
jgi:hypothetical protein